MAETQVVPAEVGAQLSAAVVDIEDDFNAIFDLDVGFDVKDVDALWGHLSTQHGGVSDNMMDLLLQQQQQPPPQHTRLELREAPAFTSNQLPITMSRQPAPEVIDLTSSDDESPAMDLASTGNVLTEEVCLQHVLQVLPDINHDHVRQLYSNALPVPGELKGLDKEQWMNTFINNILEGGKYPVQKERVRDGKRKREEDEEESWRKYEKTRTPEVQDEHYFVSGIKLLQNAFPKTRSEHIVNTLRGQNTVFKAYQTLTRDSSEGIERLAKRRKQTEIRSPTHALQLPHGHQPGGANSKGFKRAERELNAAKRKQAHEDEKKRREEEHVRAEEENVRLAQEQGTMVECGCCCIEYPINRMLTCMSEDASPVHMVCHGCIKSHIESEIGMNRYKIVCIHMNGCESGFAIPELQRGVPQQLLDKLARIQQEDEVRRAEIEGLVECPFCDFMAICPPAAEDKEFRCINEDCKIVSCRLCKLRTHVPLTCEEKKKEEGIDARHEIEEAMTAALVRNCNKCKKKFVKETGCNRMTCSNCQNMQCYVCGVSINDLLYRHFGPNGCPMHDDTQQRHLTEVKKAERKAVKKVLEENPELTGEELRVQVSDAVNLDEQRKVERRHPPHRYNFPVDPRLELQMGALRQNVVAQGQAGARAAVPPLAPPRVGPVGPPPAVPLPVAFALLPQQMAMARAQEFAQQQQALLQHRQHQVYVLGGAAPAYHAGAYPPPPPVGGVPMHFPAGGVAAPFQPLLQPQRFQEQQQQQLEAQRRQAYHQQVQQLEYQNQHWQNAHMNRRFG